MEKQTFTQAQAREMYESICHFNDDYSFIDFKKVKKKSLIDYVYVTGFRELAERIAKEIKTRSQ